MFGATTETINHLLDPALHWTTILGWSLGILLGGWLVAGWAERAVHTGMVRLNTGDAMLRGFFSSLTRWSILIFSVLAALERMGVQTASVVAVLGATGLAIGLALQSILASLAAGLMLQMFRHFRVGDFIEAATLSGSVRSVSLFHTELITPENVLVIIPNSKIWGSTIRNFTALSTHRLTLTVPVPYPADAEAAMGRIRSALSNDDRIAADPAPFVALVKFGDTSAEIEVQVWCATDAVQKLKADLMVSLWRNCLREMV